MQLKALEIASHATLVFKISTTNTVCLPNGPLPSGFYFPSHKSLNMP